MINHARTVLMNSSLATAGHAPGEQYVPTEFVTIQLPTYLQVLREKLFGRDPDRAMLNYRLAQYMTVLHSSELEQFVTALDPRITYTDATGGVRNDLFTAATYEPSYYGGTMLLSFQGQPAAPDISGRMYYSYSLDLSKSQVIQQAPRRGVTDIILTGDYELSDPIPLPGSGYSVRVEFPNSTVSDGVIVEPLPATPHGVFSSSYFAGLSRHNTYLGLGFDAIEHAVTAPSEFDAAWQIEFYNRPQWDLGQIAETLKTIGEVVELSLFGLVPAEPYLTFKNLFHDHPELCYSFGGLLLAVIYRSNEILTGTSNG